MLHVMPICFVCNEDIPYAAVYAAPCDHATCPSAAWHGACLIDHREKRERMKLPTERGNGRTT
jgi:hypothetical protein